jgi:thiamine biosynthesis lipoprotein
MISEAPDMTFDHRRRLCLAGLASLLGPSPGQAAQAAQAAQVGPIGGPAFGSYWRLSGVGAADAARLRPDIEAVIASVDAALSPYRLDSEIARFNAGSSTGWFAVSDQTHSVVAAALAMARRCRGSYDPTVGPLVGRHGFGPIGGSRMGDHRQLSASPGAIRKDDPGLTIDLCGMAKGHALDRMVQAIDRAGVGHYLLELGGEVVARGHHPSTRPWQVAIEDPRPGIAGLVHLVALDGQAIATSGNKVHGYDLAGRRYGHIADPLTSTCVGTRLLSVSVLAAKAITADGLATGMMAMGPDQAAAFADGAGIDALLLLADGPGLRTVVTGRFGDRVVA